MAVPQAKTLVVLDLDGTMTKRDTYLSFLLGFLLRHPERLPRCLVLPPAVALFRLGYRSNGWLKTRFLRAILAGTPRDELLGWAEQFIDGLLSDGLRPQASAAIRRHRGFGHRLVLATASFDFYSRRLGEMLGFDQVVCTESSWSPRGTLEGRIGGSNCYGMAKLERLKQVLGPERSDWHVIAYSDHHSDMPLLLWADRAVAVNPTRELASEARRHAFEIADWGR